LLEVLVHAGGLDGHVVELLVVLLPPADHSHVAPCERLAAERFTRVLLLANLR